MCNERIIAIEYFWDHAEALEAVGLSDQAMSQENVEMARQAFEAFNASGLSAMAEFWDPEIVWHTDPLVPEPGVYEGKEAVRAFAEGFIRAFGAWRLEVHELIDLGGEDVLSRHDRSRASALADAKGDAVPRLVP